MAFRDFMFPEVQEQLGLQVEDADLFAATPPFSVPEPIADFIRDGVALALANSTEKAKSEFIIAPVLLELRRMVGPKFSLFSGVEWNADPSRGLNGYCDYIITRGPSQYILRSPFVAIVEAKNDLIRTGFGQCIAAMVAARWSNEQANLPEGTVFGVVTTGGAWKFLRLRGSLLTMDVPEYFIDNLPKIMGILRAIVSHPGP
jgi:hypothetical protein